MKIIGLVTEDFRFFHLMVRLLKEREEPFVSLGFDDPIPENVGAIITTKEERDRVRFDTIVSDGDPDIAFKAARSVLRGKRFSKIVAGIDPGRRPGIAVIGDGKLIDTALVYCPEDVAETLTQMTRNLNFDSMMIRIGHGDPTNRNRIIHAVWSLADEVEIVDESKTTKRTVTPDIDAAITIAFTSGEKVDVQPEVCPTPGEVRDIKRLSRIESRGRVTISTELASQVARGKISLAEALDVYQKD
ncbi:MAG: hypothetical protein ABR986_08005 [Methanomassiliicoccales archaeon]|jgi:hypothetical protein